MREDRPLLGEVEDYYRKFDNDSLYVALKSGLRGLSILFFLCFLLWPIGYYQSRNWPVAKLEGIIIEKPSGWSEHYTGYRVNGEVWRLHRVYFGGSPPHIFGGLFASMSSQVVYYDPSNPSDHVLHRSPSWMTIVLPFLSAISLGAAHWMTRYISPEADKTALLYKD